MIAYINTQMSIWGKWAARMESKDRGFKPSPTWNSVLHGGAYKSSIPTGVEIGSLDDILYCDKAVNRLSKDMKSLANEFYKHHKKADYIARSLGISRRTLYDRIDAMHQQMLGHLNDVIAGC